MCTCSCRSASEDANEAAANISHHMCSAHTICHGSTNQYDDKSVLTNISYLKVTHGLCDLQYTTSEVVLDLSDTAL